MRQVAVIVSSGTGFIKTGQRDGEENKHEIHCDPLICDKFRILNALI